MEMPKWHERWAREDHFELMAIENLNSIWNARSSFCLMGFATIIFFLPPPPSQDIAEAIIQFQKSWGISYAWILLKTQREFHFYLWAHFICSNQLYRMLSGNDLICVNEYKLCIIPWLETRGDVQEVTWSYC